VSVLIELKMEWWCQDLMLGIRQIFINKLADKK